jgi:LuxR family maltose regulon positive regulatory protein
LRLQGIGHIKARGQARAAGVVKSCELLHRDGEWHLSLTIECADVDVARQRSEHHAMAADRGVSGLCAEACSGRERSSRGRFPDGWQGARRDRTRRERNIPDPPRRPRHSPMRARSHPAQLPCIGSKWRLQGEQDLVRWCEMEDFSALRTTLPRLRADFVQRPQLRLRLVEGLAHGKLVLLSAPAGYGKTVALVQTLSQLPADHAVAWVGASDDDDLQRLLMTLLAALDSFDLPWRMSPEALPAVALREGGLGAAVDELVHALEQAEAEHGVMAFDDMHRIVDARVFDFFERLLAELPSKWTVAMTSRTEPPLSLARMLVAGELTEFREDALSFEREDVQALLQAAQQPVTPERVEQLMQRTRGWPVGLSLELMAQSGQLAQSIRAQRRRFEYLAQEVLDQLPPQMQQFLLRCSVLSELTLQRCRQVSGDVRAGHWLEELERRGLFVAELDDEAHTLRLHDLFREFLGAKLTRERYEELPQLLKRAAESEPDTVRRLDYLLRAGAADEAALAMFNEAASMIYSGAGEQLIRLIERFPEPLRSGAPELAFVRGLFAGQRFEFITMLTSMRSALTGFEHKQQWSQALKARGLTCMALYYLGRTSEGFELWNQAVHIDTDPATQIVDAFIAFWRSLICGPSEPVPHELSRIVRLIPEVDPNHWVLQFPVYFAAVGRRRMRGLLCALVDTMLGAGSESRPQVKLAALRLLAWLTMWEGNVDEATRLCKEVSAEAQWLGNPLLVVIYNNLLVAYERHLSGDYAQARMILQEIIDAARRNPQRRAHHLYVNLLGGLATAAQDWRTAQELLLIADDAATERPEWPFLKPSTAALGAEIALHEGRPADAIAQLRPLLVHVPDWDAFGIDARFRVALARAELCSGNSEAAWEVLSPALHQSMEAGELVGLLLCGPIALRELAEARWPSSAPAAELAYLRDCATRAVQLRSSTAPGAPTALAPGAPPSSLSDRERQVIELVAQGQSNKLIARALGLSPHTVKRHMARILDKTGQSSRGQLASWHRSHAA